MGVIGGLGFVGLDDDPDNPVVITGYKAARTRPLTSAKKQANKRQPPTTNGSGWSAGESFGLGASGAGFGTNADGRIEIIAGISAGPLNGRYQLVPSGNWSPWAPVGGPPLA